MTYYQFIQAVQYQVKEVIEEEVFISPYTAEKNNGVKREGLTISQEGINISPTIYLEEYYDKYKKGYSIENVAEDIAGLYQEVRLKKSWDEALIHTYESIEHKIIYRLINYEANKKLLEQVPFEPYLDLAIVFYVMLEINEYGTACMLIRNEHLKMWGVTQSEIYERAHENTWKLLPPEFHTMREMLEEYKQEGSYVGMDVLHVLTNKLRGFGAAVILYDECLEMIAEYMDDNYYVLPSSVHEVIIVSEKDAPWDGEGLSEMVSEINRTQVDPEEVLSDSAYYYDRSKRELT